MFDKSNINFLQKIEDYVKDNNIPFKVIPIKTSLMSSGFINCVKKGFINIRGSYQESKIADYMYFYFDENDHLYLNIFDKNNGHTISILKDNVHYRFINKPFKLLREADIFFYADNNEINQANDAFNEVIKNLNIKLPGFEDRFEIISELKEKKSMNDILDETSDIICDYISYLFEVYEETEKLNEQDIILEEQNSNEEQEEQINKIFFYEDDNKGSKTPRAKISKTTPERKNDELSIDDRFAIIEKHPYLYKAIASATNTDSIYHTYCFELKDKDDQVKSYRIIMEPDSPFKYTKIMYINNDSNVTYDDFSDYAKIALSLSRDEITKSNEISRHTHTTMDEYKGLIDYTLGDEDAKLTWTVKNKVKGYVKRLDN